MRICWMPQIMPLPEQLASMDAPALEPAKAYSTDIDADPELGDVEPMPTQAGMEISFKVPALPPHIRAPDTACAHVDGDTRDHLIHARYVPA